MAVLLAILPFAVATSPLLMDDNVAFVGRVQKAADGTVMFDMNGVQVQATVTGTTGLSASMSQITKQQGNMFQVYLDGVLQPTSFFNTASWNAAEVVKVPLFPAGTFTAESIHTVTIFKDSEPAFAEAQVKPNYITFHGFSGDDDHDGISSTARLLPLKTSLPQHKVEFLGDSITAGFDNQCDIAGSPKGFPWSESFAKSWANLICNAVGAECHFNAWSGLGMVRNCCGGSTLASDVWTRTLATVQSDNTSDPHGTTAENMWDFSKWTADAVVINLGTNDHLGGNATAPLPLHFQTRYLALVAAASKAYGKNTRFFLACGPMSSDYCTEVNWVIKQTAALGIQAYLLDQRGFINSGNTYGKACAYGHPGSRIDWAMAKNGSDFITATMGWPKPTPTPPPPPPPGPPGPCAATEFCPPINPPICSTPTGVSCSKDAKVLPFAGTLSQQAASACGAGQVCDPFTFECVTTSHPCTPTNQCFASEFCCPDAKACLTLVAPGTMCDPTDKSACPAPQICCPLIKQCVTARGTCDPALSDAPAFVAEQ